MDNDQSSADQIRLKRLAKLQQQQQQQQQKQQEASSSKKPVSENKAKPFLQTLDEFVPLKQPIKRKVEQKAPPAQQQPAAPKKVVSSPPSVKPAKSFEDWQDDVLSRILQVTLNPSNIYKQGKCVYLGSLASELEEEQVQLKLNNQFLDRIIVARLLMDPTELANDIPQDIVTTLHVLHFDYLLNCWNTANDVRKNTVLRSKNLEPAALNQRIQVLDNVKGLLVSYSGLIIQMPDMFPQIQSDHLGPEQLVSRLKSEPDTPQGLPNEYLTELIQRFSQDGLDTIIGPAMAWISGEMRSENILSESKKSIHAFSYLCDKKEIASMITTLPEFNPDNVTAKNVEELSLLGSFFRLTAYPDSAPKVAENYFQNSENRNNADLMSCKNGLRGSVQQIQRAMFTICNSIIRSNANARNALLDYFAHIIKLNEKRAQMQVDMQTVSSDGFMHNIAAVMLQFCDPFMDIRASKIDKIDPDYFRTSKRFDFSEDTKINATKEQSDAYYQQIQEKPHNFITESFFTALAFMHYGPIRGFVNYNEFMREYNEVKKQNDKAQQDAASAANTPQGIMANFVATRMKAKYEQMTSFRLAYETMLLDPVFLTEALRFYDLVMAWVVRIVDGKHKHPWEPISLPLPAEVPDVFSMLPEWIIEDIVEIFIFIGKYGFETQVMQQCPHDELVTFVITFLNNTKYVKNPYLKAKLVEILFFFTFPIGRGIPGELEGLLNSHPLALKFLVPSLMSFYVEVEQTGASSQFYDKFNIRYNISNIMKRIWSHPAHRGQLREVGTKDPELFTRFVNMLMSDVTYLLDESLTKLSEIHQIQKDMEDTAAWEAQPPQQRQEREGNLPQLERQAQSYIALGNETVHLLKVMSAEVVQPFLAKEIADRLAAMLDYNLVQLVGPKCTELKVKNPEKYHFRPRNLLSEIIDVYLNLNSDTFVASVARDGRSYRKEYFSKAASILQKHNLKSADEISALGKFVSRVERSVQSTEEEEEELGEVPDEFLDPIFFTLMDDPVLLPTSGNIVDKSTIRTHLLGDARDPFNRKPLTIDMVQPDDELREKILKWKSDQKKNKSTPMDTSL